MVIIYIGDLLIIKYNKYYFLNLIFLTNVQREHQNPRIKHGKELH